MLSGTAVQAIQCKGKLHKRDAWSLHDTILRHAAADWRDATTSKEAPSRSALERLAAAVSVSPPLSLPETVGMSMMYLRALCSVRVACSRPVRDCVAAQLHRDRSFPSMLARSTAAD